MTSAELASKSLFFQSVEDNVWRIDIPSNWNVPQHNSTTANGSSPHQVVHLKPATSTAPMQCQIGAAPGDGVRNDDEIQESSPRLDIAESLIKSSLWRAANDGWWMDDDAVETSTTIYEARGAFHRTVGSGRPTTHRRTSFGSTQSSSSLESLPKEDIQILWPSPSAHDMPLKELAVNGLFSQGVKDNIWNVDIPSSWNVTEYPRATTHQNPSHQTTPLRQNPSTAAMQHQAGEGEAITATRQIDETPNNFGWDDSEILATSTVVDEADGAIGGSLQRAMSNSEWRDDDVWETSTTIYEAALVAGVVFERTVGSGRAVTHRRVGSESTQSSASIETLHGDGDIDEDSSDQVMHLRPTEITAAMPPQPVATANVETLVVEHEANEPAVAPDALENLVWNDDEIVETSTTVDEAEFMAGGTIRRAIDSLAWRKDEILETSTAIDETERIVGSTLRRASVSGLPTARHHRTDSGSTQSSATLQSIPDASARVRTWADVVRSVGQRQSESRK
ncbi:uncharacterized protein B0H18DRAFT_1126486 [Fomitopsis serialis]|uniref:uncharacterized protein n=1 Tax=Fomitopsis serialis TaxID=139415 RepID=UPI0020073EBF|nr:uncharacterized protein B0H18DRAFT_1126486 [Neoantrodia serialis]KAH9913203.1 hypothetical protein B0H18DRAFT_1126486 [Neoantrodia serialis]